MIKRMNKCGRRNMLKKMIKDFLQKIKTMIKDQNNHPKLHETQKEEQAEDEEEEEEEEEEQEQEQEQERDNLHEAEKEVVIVVEGEGDRDWSHIPGPFLWGVMDYLTSFEAMRISYVCNHWRYIMKPEPNKVTIPWVLCNPSSSISNYRTFIDLSTNTTSRVHIPHHVSEDTCINSKNGWLLLLHSIEFIEEFYLKWKLRLFHPVSGTIIDLPEIIEGDCLVLGPAIIGPIRQLTGKPKLIIQASYGALWGIVLRITRPGQSKWEVHRFEHCIGWEYAVAKVVMHGSTRVCCFDPMGRMCVFNMVDKSWLAFPDLCNSRPGLVTWCEDEVVKVSPLPLPLHGNQERFIFYKLELDENGVVGWVEMDTVGLENRWWFIDRKTGESFCVKGVGRKVFQLFGQMVNNDDGDEKVTVPLSVVNLADGIQVELMPELAIHDYELGWIHMASPVSV